MRAGFFRIYHLEVRIQNRLERAEMRVTIENEVDPLSGMTLNLMDLDAHQRELQAQISTQTSNEDFGAAAQVWDRALSFWRGRFSLAGSLQLQRLELQGLGQVHGWVWQGASYLSARVRAEIRFGGQLKQGWCEYLLPASTPESSLPISQLSVTVSGENDITPRLRQHCAAAVTAQFRDEVTGESWGYQS